MKKTEVRIQESEFRSQETEVKIEKSTQLFTSNILDFAFCLLNSDF
jgi:hypothetical protein